MQFSAASNNSLLIWFLELIFAYLADNQMLFCISFVELQLCQAVSSVYRPEGITSSLCLLSPYLLHLQSVLRKSMPTTFVAGHMQTQHI